MSMLRLSSIGALASRGARVALIGLAVCVLAALSAAPAGAFTDLSGGAFQILAPGQEGGFTPGPFSTDQGALYDALTPLQGKVSTRKLEHDYLSEKFGVTGLVLRVENTGRAGLEIVRDSHDIPHIYGETRADVMFGSGWVAAEDRGLLLRLGLGPAYAAALSIPGVNPFELLLRGRSFTPSAQAVSFVSEQKKVLIEKGARGEQVIGDLEEWAEGINAYEQTLPAAARLPTVTATDAIAGFAFIGSIFGNGGGNEVGNSNFLARLQAKLGEAAGTQVFHDLREANDPEAPTTTSKPFPYDQQPTGSTPGALVIDPGSTSATAAHAAQALRSSRRKASNFLLVGPKHTKSGHPLAVMGPQLGYFYPEIVMQADMHGPGIDAEGVVAPISPYVFIGRGRDFAWSLTSAGSENTQQFLEKLCNPDGSAPTRESDHYEHNGECIAMTTMDAGLLGAGNGEPAHEVTFKETVHGPVSGTVLVKGQPYAVATDRSTRGREPAGELAFSDLDSDRVHSPQQFFEAANEVETTFNMAYLDSNNIAFFSTGRLPVLAAGTDPSLPTVGTGAYDWKGFLSQEQHPHEVAPASDLLLNWNNKPAPEWGAASDNYSQGPVDRVQLYTGFSSGMNEASDVSIMNRAATQDLRAVKVWPVIQQVLAGSPAPSKLAEEAANLVTAWVASGASRLGQNHPKAPAAAVLDAIWTPISEAVLGPVLGELTPEFESMVSPDDAPSPTGSAYDSGWYGYVEKDLSSELGAPVVQPYSRQYCGGGSLAACRQSLWSVIQTAAQQLAATQGPEPSAWHAAGVRIQFPPGLLPYTMRWTNRSTFQQVIEFTGHVEEGLGGPLTATGPLG
jgi:acyl-homoserine lactone acylase PvdQ